MSTSVYVVNVSVPFYDTVLQQSTGIDSESFFKSIVPLCFNGLACISGEQAFYNSSFVATTTNIVYTFFIPTANASSALALYTTFQASIPAPYTTEVWYVLQTSGV